MPEVILIYLFAALANAVLALLPVIIPALVAFGIYALIRRRLLTGLVAIAVAATPFIAYAMRTTAIDEVARQEKEAAESRAKSGPLANWPKLLVVNGSLRRGEVARMMLDGQFARILVASAYDHQNRSMSFTLREGSNCEEKLRDRLTFDGSMRWSKPYRREPAENDPLLTCLEAEPASIDDLRNPMTALFLTSRQQRTSPGGIAHTKVLELRLRESGVEELVDVWENSYRQRPVAPWLVDIRGFAQRSDYDKKGNPSLVEFVLANLKR